MGDAAAKRIVVKVGSSSLTDDEGEFRLGAMANLVDELSHLHRAGYEVLLVSSGAVSSGMGPLGLRERPRDVIDQQAAAAVGQGRLFHTYSHLFSMGRVVTAQVLLTANDVMRRTQYLNARNTLLRLVQWRVLPIINENDTTATDELRFGDNDSLAAQVAILVQADTLVLLTDIDAVYSADPRVSERAEPIREVHDFAEIEHVKLGDHGRIGRGGMQSKVAAARMATAGGVETIIARGGVPGNLLDAVAGKAVGTRFHARDRGLSAFKLWLLYGKPTQGEVMVDDGAIAALRKGASLLPVGIRAVTGAFEEGDSVRVVDVQMNEVARGITNWGAESLTAIAGLRTHDIEQRHPGKAPEAIHYDYLALAEAGANTTHATGANMTHATGARDGEPR